jgi:hypothetical protein
MNILLLAFEGESRIMTEIALKFKREGHNVCVASCDHFNVTHSSGEVFRFYSEMGLSEKEWTSLASVFAAINSLPIGMTDSEVDWRYFEEFETKYCRKFSIHRLIAMDPLYSPAFHHRSIYYRPPNKAILYKAIELHLKWLESVFIDNSIEAVVTVNFQYLVKAAAYTMAHSLGVPFLTVASCRINDLNLIYDNYTMGTPSDIQCEMQRLASAGDECREARNFKESKLSTRDAAYSDFLITARSISNRLKLGPRLREIWHMFTVQLKKDLLVNKHYRGRFCSNYFLPSHLRILRTMVMSLHRRYAYFWSKDLVQKELPSGPFVFFPLHLMPENSVLTLSETYNEYECLFQLSASLPVGWKVVVKINPNMLADFDTHPNRYYREMAALPNVIVVDPMMPSGEILPHCAAVACISGTALLEGALFGKPGVRWGRTEFEVVDTISEFSSKELQEHLNQGESRNLEQYLQACFNLGIALDLRLLCQTTGSRIPEDRESEYLTQIEMLYARLRERLGLGAGSIFGAGASSVAKAIV